MGIDMYDYFLALVGLSISIFGLIIWKKQKINLIYGYNSRNVKKEDVKEYTESMGKAQIIVGIATLPLIILKLTDNDVYECIVVMLWVLGVVMGIIKTIKTQKRYKTGIWG